MNPDEKTKVRHLAYLAQCRILTSLRVIKSLISILAKMSIDGINVGVFLAKFISTIFSSFSLKAVRGGCSLLDGTINSQSYPPFTLT